MIRAASLFSLLLVFTLTSCDSVEERIEKHYSRGQELIEAGEHQKAALEFQNALKLNEKHAPSHFALGTTREALGGLEAAFVSYRTAAELNPEMADAHMKLARFYTLASNLEQANIELFKVLELEPNRADALALQAILLMRGGDSTAAKQILDRALVIAPGNLEVALAEISYLRTTVSPASALPRIDETIAAHPDSLGAHIAKVQILEQIDDQSALGQQLAVMIKRFPKQIRFREARANWAMRNQDLDAAEQELRGIVTALPENREPILMLLRFLRQHRSDDAARAELAAQIERSNEPFPLEIMLAQFDIETGRTEAASEFLNNLMARNDDNSGQARVMLARLLIEQGKEDAGYALVDQVLANDPSNVEGLALQIARRIDDGAMTDAIELVRLALNEAPEDARILLLAARAQELNGNIDLANDRLAKAVRLRDYDPQITERYFRFLLRTNRVNAAETILLEALQRTPGSLQLLDLLGSARMAAENWGGVNEIANAIEKRDPVRARQLRAAALIGQERFDEGIGLLSDLPDDDTRRAASIAALVQTYIRDGRPEEAEAFLNDLLEKNPKNIQALGVLGNLYLANGDPEAAELQYQKVLEVDPANGGAYSALARLAEQRGDLDSAEETLLSGLQASPNSLVLLLRLAQVSEFQQRFADSINFYEQLYAQVPDSMLVANNLANMLAEHRNDNPVMIERAYAIAGRLRDSTQPEYQDTYAWTRYLKGEYLEALTYAKKAYEAAPNNTWIQYHLGMIHAALKQDSDARTHLEAVQSGGKGVNFPFLERVNATLNQLSP